VILPDKHITPRRSVVGMGAIIIRHLSQPRTVSSLWESARKIHELENFNRFIVALTFLFSVGAVELASGRLQRVIASDQQDQGE
jgi:hypothetical protein